MELYFHTWVYPLPIYFKRKKEMQNKGAFKNNYDYWIEIAQCKVSNLDNFKTGNKTSIRLPSKFKIMYIFNLVGFCPIV